MAEGATQRGAARSTGFKQQAALTPHLGNGVPKPGPEPRRPGPEPRRPGPEPCRPGPEPRRPGPEPRRPGPEPHRPGPEPHRAGCRQQLSRLKRLCQGIGPVPCLLQPGANPGGDEGGPDQRRWWLGRAWPAKVALSRGGRSPESRGHWGTHQKVDVGQTQGRL